ncbi:unnamed protein product [Paramecium sonneborni]|uniref:Uncharacterized protein n=1 Tax=Paramecium sonneborni TaxID=65129 RepID=A0A8S1NNB5_9CILI|nr:unnamed protein product [Paramecium sonneborni]CAD8090555.1 unnamed protein product [Paramecium sonneborni]
MIRITLGALFRYYIFLNYQQTSFYCSLKFILSLVFSLRETITKINCLYQYCSVEVNTCQKDQTWKKQIADCYQNTMDDLSPANIKKQSSCKNNQIFYV